MDIVRLVCVRVERGEARRQVVRELDVAQVTEAVAKLAIDACTYL
jgi:hypothetical protein